MNQPIHSIVKTVDEKSTELYVKSALLLGSVLLPSTVFANTKTPLQQIQEKTGYQDIRVDASGSTGDKVISGATKGVEMILAVGVLIGVAFVVVGIVKWRSLANQNQPIAPAVMTILLGIAAIAAGAIAFGFSAEITNFLFKSS